MKTKLACRNRLCCLLLILCCWPMSGVFGQNLVPSNVDFALAIDRSGSMAGGKIAETRTVASSFVSFMQPGDKIAVASFATTATVDFPLTTIADHATITSAREAIAGISASGADADQALLNQVAKSKFLFTSVPIR